jgi:hypothetical protein
MKTLYRSIAGVIGLVAVAIQYWLVTQGPGGAPSVHFFSFFTILTNLLAAAAMLLPVVAPSSSAGRFLDRPSVRTAITGYIVIVGTVYFALLRNLDHATGLRLLFEYVLHYVTPPLFVLDWLLFVPKGEIAGGTASTRSPFRSFTSAGRSRTGPMATGTRIRSSTFSSLAMGAAFEHGGAHYRLPGTGAFARRHRPVD